MTGHTATLNKRQLRKEETYTRLTAEARRLFLAQSYDTVSVNDILAATGLTKGGFYFHVADKRTLFRIVAVEVNRDIANQMEQAAFAETEPWDGLIAAFRVFFQVLEEPGMHRFFYRDGISVLGFADWLAVNRDHSFASVDVLVDRLIASGVLETRHPQLFGLLICGAADYVGDHAFDLLASNKLAMREASDALVEMLERFRTHPGQAC